VEIVIAKTQQQGVRIVGDTIAGLLNKKPTAVIGLATGSTPLAVYDDLVARYEGGEISFAHARGFALDEYVGLPGDHPESYRAVLQREIVGRVDFADGAVRTPDGWAKDIPAACQDYEHAIDDAGGVDLQILGVGTDGHIGFNEPTSSLASLTRIKSLTAVTREDNARFFGGDVSAVPTHVVTQGVGTIRRAKHLVLLAWGEQKAQAIADTVEGPVTSMVPSSALQLHPHATVIVDAAAAANLKLAHYYSTVFDGKPEWQGI
jgi:glucosamine-6-phosphate deaminase